MLCVTKVVMLLSADLHLCTPTVKVFKKRLLVTLQKLETHQNLLFPDWTGTKMDNLFVNAAEHLRLIIDNRNSRLTLACADIRTRRVLFFPFLFFTLCTFLGVYLVFLRVYYLFLGGNLVFLGGNTLLTEETSS